MFSSIASSLRFTGSPSTSMQFLGKKAELPLADIPHLTKLYPGISIKDFKGTLNQRAEAYVRTIGYWLGNNNLTYEDLTAKEREELKLVKDKFLLKKILQKSHNVTEKILAQIELRKILRYELADLKS